jgi:hypothetical protein
MIARPTMRHVLAAALLAGLAAVPSPAQQRPSLDEVAPLSHPRAPGALRGISLTVGLTEPDPEGIALRCANYLTRLLEAAGASVALVLDPEQEAAVLARSTASAVCVIVDGTPRPGTALDRSLAGLSAASLPTVLQVAPVPAEQGSDTALAHREPAQRTFEAIRAACAPKLDALRAAREDRTTAARRLDPLWPLDRPPATAAEAQIVLDNWRARTAVDRSQVYLQVEVVEKDGRMELRGATELPLLEAAARRTLQSVGVREVGGALRRLPDLDALGGPPFAIVDAASAVTWRLPGASTGHGAIDPPGQVEETELRRGEPVRLLDRQDGFVLAHAQSGYLGWVPERALLRCDQATFAARLRAVTLGESEPPQPAGIRAAERAVERIGTPYVFGGRSANGIDCSGLVETSWAGEGVFLPRDAGQQILAGSLVATAAQPAPLEPGDLIFFANQSGRISHVAVSLGGFRFVHATPPEVTVASLDPGDPAYAPVAERFVLAKRVAR